MRRISEIAIFTDRPAETTAFYERLFGVAPSARWPGGATFAIGGLTVLIHERTVPGPGEPPDEDHIALAVDDVDDAVGELRIRPVAGPDDYDWGRSAYLRDPEGRLVELHQTPGDPQ